MPNLSKSHGPEENAPQMCQSLSFLGSPCQGSGYRYAEGHMTFRPMVTLPMGERSRYLCGNGQVTFPQKVRQPSKGRFAGSGPAKFHVAQGQALRPAQFLQTGGELVFMGRVLFVFFETTMPTANRSNNHPCKPNLYCDFRRVPKQQSKKERH